VRLWSGAGQRRNPMDQRIEAFLTDVLALAGEDPEALREGVRVALADCEALFRAGQRYKHMRDQTALIGRALCRSRVVAEMQKLRGTRLAEHLKLVLTIIDWRGRVESCPPAASRRPGPSRRLARNER